MEFFKLSKFRNAHNPVPENVTQNHQPDEGIGRDISYFVSNSHPENNIEVKDEEEDDDDDFITNEVKRRLKELRRNSFMVLIPEESALADEEEEGEEGESSSSEWRNVEMEGRQFWSGFDAVYDIYCERMLFFDRSSVQHLQEVGSHVPSTRSPRSAPKKLASPLGCLSLRNFDAQEEVECLQKPYSDPYHDLETAYVAQVCLTWEVLHCQFTQFSQKISQQPESPNSYNHSAQLFQQFQVLLQRFVENEPFGVGSRSEIYARTRISLPKLLQVPKIQGTNEKDGSDLIVGAHDLLKVIEGSILSFHEFMKKEKEKIVSARSRLGSQSHISSLEHLQSLLDKKAMKLKMMWKKRQSYRKKSWPTATKDVELLLGLVDVKVVSRVVRSAKVSKEQLLWCQEKMKKLDFSDGNFLRDPSPILFPC